jgi:hypothetical protein
MSSYHHSILRDLRLTSYAIWYLPVLGLIGTGILTVTLVVLSFLPAANDWCAQQSLGCSIGTNFAVVLIVAGSSFYWIFGYRRSRLLQIYRRFFEDDIQSRRLRGYTLPASRQTLIKLAVREVLQGTKVSTVVFTGDRGEGKTTALSYSAMQLINSWRIPVYLDSVPDSRDILEMLRGQLAQALSPSIRTDAELDAFWRLLLRCGRIVVLIDGLDETESTNQITRHQTVAKIVDLVRRLKLPLLATAQQGTLQRLPVVLLPLPRFGQSDIISYLMRHAPKTTPEELNTVAKDLPEELASPFYLRLIAELLAAGGIDTLPPGLDGRVSVLCLWLERTCAHHLKSSPAKNSLLPTLGCIALAMTSSLLTESSRGQLPLLYTDILTRVSDDATEVSAEHIRHGIEAGILTVNSSIDRFAFQHSLVQAFIGAALLVNIPDFMPKLLVNGVDSLMRTTLLFAVVLERLSIKAESAQTVRGQLALAAMTVRGEERTDLLSTVITGTGNLVRQASNSLVASLSEVSSFACAKRAVDSLDTLPPGIREQHLWTVCRNTRYSIRIEAAIKLARSGADTEVVLEGCGEILRRVQAAEDAGGLVSDWRYALPMWLLPSATELNNGKRPANLLKRAIMISSGHMDPANFELSMSRGFKLAAWLRRDIAVDLQVLNMLNGSTRYWFSRLNLVHAVALRLDSTKSKKRGRLETDGWKVLVRMKRDPHPLVREAAKLCVDVIRTGGNLESVVWLHEAEAMTRAEISYSDKGWRLLGDVYLHLNQVMLKISNSTPSLTSLWIESAELPRCLGRSAVRSEFFEGCPEECGYGLCPYPFPNPSAEDRGEISAYFCQVQSDVASRIGPGPWQSKISSELLTGFWQRVEDQIYTREM